MHIHATGVININESDNDFYNYDRPANNVINFWQANMGIAEKLSKTKPLLPKDLLSLKKSKSCVVEDFRKDRAAFMRELEDSISYLTSNRETVSDTIGNEKTQNFLNGLLLIRELVPRLPGTFKKNKGSTPVN